MIDGRWQKSCSQCSGEIDEKLRNRKEKFCSIQCRNVADKENKASSRLAPGTVGALSELVACSDLLKKGYEVFRAVSPSCSCDLVILKNEKLLRVEVKTGSRSKNGKIHFGGAGPSKKVRHDVFIIVIGSEVIYTPDLTSKEN